MERINGNTKYFYCYPSVTVAKNDKYGDKLTSGDAWVSCEIVNHEYTLKTRYNTTIVHDFDEYVESHMYFQNDWGLVSEVEGASIKFLKIDALPKRIELFFTDDGYNYTLYKKPAENIIEEENTVTYEFFYETPVRAKGVRCIIFADTDKQMRFSDFSVYGKKNENEIKLLSKGLKYQWIGGKPEEITTEKDLTDGVIAKYDEIEKCEARTATEAHPISCSEVSVINTDLGEVRNVFEVCVHSLSTKDFINNVKYISVEYSLDGKEYSAFAQGYRWYDFGEEDSFTSIYPAMRNHTVRARYIRIYVTGSVALSQFEIFGTDNEISEPKYDHFYRKELLAHTNVLDFKPVIVNGEETDRLTDNYFSCNEEDLELPESEILCDIGEVKEEINSVMLYFRNKNGFVLPDKVETYVSSDGKDFELIEGEYQCHQTGSFHVKSLYFDNRAARYIKFVITGEKRMTILQVAAYQKQPQLPLYRGGFYQIHLLEEGVNSEHPVIKNDEYMWYVQLKGMMDMGMDYVILQHGVSPVGKKMSMYSPRLAKKGYKIGYGHGTFDPYTVVMKQAEKLGMKVYIGTGSVFGRYYNTMEAGGVEAMKPYLPDIEEYIKDIYEKYNGYKSFEGYYHSEETCDEWLNGKYALDVYRLLYGTMTKAVRKLDPNRKTMFCPAIWRTGSPAQAEEIVYQLMKPEKEGEGPLVDILAAQDCLGRAHTYFVPTWLHQDFEEHAEAMARGARRAGAQFWNDAEVFERTYRTKRFPDIVDQVELEAKYSNGTIIFDYPHHFCDWTRDIANNRNTVNTAYITSRYIKRYFEKFRDLDRIGID